jgi:hypothetical protein
MTDEGNEIRKGEKRKIKNINWLKLDATTKFKNIS